MSFDKETAGVLLTDCVGCDIIVIARISTLTTG